MRKDEFKDIPESGCRSFSSVGVGGKKYDPVAIENGILRLGGRPSDGNMYSADRRPKSSVGGVGAFEKVRFLIGADKKDGK